MQAVNLDIMVEKPMNWGQDDEDCRYEENFEHENLENEELNFNIVTARIAKNPRKAFSIEQQQRYLHLYDSLMRTSTETMSHRSTAKKIGISKSILSRWLSKRATIFSCPNSTRKFF